MVTTIQISSPLLEQLKQMKLHEKESYEEVIWDMVEDRMELSKQTKERIKECEKDIAAENWEKFSTLEEVKEELGLNV
jgi:predicted CopG family antitoxin